MRLLSCNVQIAGTGSAVPQLRVSNDDIVKNLATSDLWIRENLGIEERRLARDPSESTAGLASKAGLQAIQSAELDVNDIDAIIVATATPEQKAPSTACLVQDRLDIRNQCMAFDLQAVCSGFIYALGVASSLIESGSVKNVLVIGADTFSTITDWDDRSCVFFGDGAGAVVVQRNNLGTGLLSLSLHANGAGNKGFHVPADSPYFVMNPKAVYETGTTVLPGAIQTVLQMADITVEDVKYVIPHQPSRRILIKMAEQLGIDQNRVLMNMTKYANTAGATVPLLLDQTARAGLLEPGDDFVMAAVGSGWTWGAAVMKWGVDA